MTWISQSGVAVGHMAYKDEADLLCDLRISIALIKVSLQDKAICKCNASCYEPRDPQPAKSKLAHPVLASILCL